MARKSFSINREPHVADLGDGDELHFLPEIDGDRFVDAYAELQAAQNTAGGEDAKGEEMSAESLQLVYKAVRTFLSKIMTDECAARFNRFEVTKGQKVIEVFQDREEADAFSEKAGAGHRVNDKSIRLPSRVLMELTEWAVELYGGGQKRPTGPSSGSSAGSRRTGTSGRAGSRSKG